MLKEYIVKKDKNETQFDKKYISNLFENDLEDFFKTNSELINVYSTAYNQEIFIIDTIRDSLLHGLFTLDFDNQKIILNNEMKFFEASLDFVFFMKFLEFEFGRIYKINNEKISFVISDYNFYNDILLKSNVKFNDLHFLNINISFCNNITKQELWHLKCSISDILGRISEYIDKNFDTNNYSEYGVLLTKILRKDFPTVLIETSKLDNEKVKIELKKNSNYSNEFFGLENLALCSSMDSLMKYHFENSSRKVLSCLHDTYISLKKFEEEVIVEKKPILLDAIKLILNSQYDYKITPRVLRNKYNLIDNNEDYDFYRFSFNKDAEIVRELKKLYKKGRITKKQYFEGLTLFSKERDKQYSSDIFLIESQDEYIIKKYMKEQDMDYELGISLRNIKLINEVLYNKYKNKLIKNNFQTNEDYSLHEEMKKSNSIGWANSIKSRTYFYDDIMPLVFLYIIGLGLYATNKDTMDLGSMNAKNIKCYTLASYRDYELRKENLLEKLVELEEQKRQKLIQLEKCTNEKGKINITNIINGIELDIQKINNYLSMDIINYNGENMRLCDKENTLRIIRNVFSHPERITLENLENLNIKLCDYNEKHEVVAEINCNVKDLMKVFDSNIVLKNKIM